MPQPPNGAARRFFIVAAILCFWIVAIVARLLYLQLFEYGDFIKQALLGNARLNGAICQ